MKKVVVITGGSDGIGRLTAKRLAKEHTVVVVSNNEEKLKEAAQELGCEYEFCDVTDHAQVEAAAARIKEKFGRIDCLLNSAGIWIQGELDENSYEDIKKVVEVNTLGTIYFDKAVIPLMKEQGKGLIVNIISQAGIGYHPTQSVYSASKWALTGLTKCLQPELSKYGIRASGVYPGKTNTELFSKAGTPRDMSDALSVEEAAKVIEFVVNSDDTAEITEIGIKSPANW